MISHTEKAHANRILILLVPKKRHLVSLSSPIYQTEPYILGFLLKRNISLLWLMGETQGGQMSNLKIKPY